VNMSENKIRQGDEVLISRGVSRKYLGLSGEVRIIWGPPFSTRYWVLTTAGYVWCRRKWLEKVR
jgi:hypothetical protein